LAPTDGNRCPSKPFYRDFQSVRREQVITVEKNHMAPDGIVQSGIASYRWTFVLLPANNSKPRVVNDI
jgi:hypothetical protein